MEADKISSIQVKKDDLIEKVRKIIYCEGTEAEIDEWLNFLDKIVPHPAISDLIFYPEKELTPSEIVEEALSYKSNYYLDSSND